MPDEQQDPTQPGPRPVTAVERQMVETAVRIVSDIARLDALAEQDPRARIGCTPAALRAAESLYAQADQMARRSADPALLDLVAKTPLPGGL
ncbi:hypothetical protein [Streptomyces gardneri]|uniref:hypothetical protein n=1 Tax=Streptomyces gardneri TaxID=66892 RepID=UPI0035DFBF15